MKKIFLMLIAAILAAPLVVSAAEGRADTGKNMCALNSEQCDIASKSASIQEKVAILQKELNKGSSVYTADELNKLQSKLDNYQSFLVSMMY